MTVVTTFLEKQREKRWKFERNVLGELSMMKLKEDAVAHFEPLFPKRFSQCPFLFEPCIDTALDAYLLGAEFSRFGYYGETSKETKKRCEHELNEIYYQLFDILEPWFRFREPSLDSLAMTVEYFIEKWWEKGFIEGEKRYKLRLHK